MRHTSRPDALWDTAIVGAPSATLPAVATPLLCWTRSVDSRRSRSFVYTRRAPARTLRLRWFCAVHTYGYLPPFILLSTVALIPVNRFPTLRCSRAPVAAVLPHLRRNATFSHACRTLRATLTCRSHLLTFCRVILARHYL